MPVDAYGICVYFLWLLFAFNVYTAEQSNCMFEDTALPGLNAMAVQFC